MSPQIPPATDWNLWAAWWLSCHRHRHPEYGKSILADLTHHTSPFKRSIFLLPTERKSERFTEMGVTNHVTPLVWGWRGPGEEESRQCKGPKRGRSCQQQGNGALGPTYASNWIWPITWMCLQVDSCAGPPEKTPTWGQMGVGPWAPGAETPSALGTSDLQNCELVELLTSSRHLCNVLRGGIPIQKMHRRKDRKKKTSNITSRCYQQ